MVNLLSGFWIFWSLAIGVALFVNVFTGAGEIPQFLARALLNGLILSVFVCLKSVRCLLASIPALHLRILAVFLTLITMGHFLDRNHATYPFVKWSMYSQYLESPEVTYFQLEGIGADNRKVILHPAKVFPPLINSAFYHRLSEIIQPVIPDNMKAPKKSLRGLRKPLAKPSEDPSARLALTLKAAGSVYNQTHPESKISAIEVIAGYLNKRDAWDAIPKRQVVWRTELENP